MDPKDGFAVITEGGDSVESVIKTIAGTTDLTEKERDALISGAIDQGLLRRKSDGKLEVIPGKAAPIKKVWSEGNRSLEILERVNAVKHGLQGIQAVVGLHLGNIAAGFTGGLIYEAIGSAAIAGGVSSAIGGAVEDAVGYGKAPTVQDTALRAIVGFGLGKILGHFTPDELTTLGLKSTPTPPAAPKFNFEHLEDDVEVPSTWNVPDDAEYVITADINQTNYSVAYGSEVSEEVMKKFNDAVDIFPIKSNDPVKVYKAHSIERIEDGKSIRALTSFQKDGFANEVYLTESAQNDLLAIADEAAHQAGYRSHQPHARFYNYLVNTPEGKHKFIKYIEKYESSPEVRLQYFERAKRLAEKAQRQGK